MIVKAALVLLASAALASGCTSGEPDRYTVGWQMSADEYDNVKARAEAALSRCTGLPGAARTGPEPASLPPVPQLTFRGSDEERQRFEDCLLALDDAVIYGPVAPDDDRPRAPILER
jgi:hypothetical protein